MSDRRPENPKEVRVHCFTCSFSVVGVTPDKAHDLMEAHYAEKHAVLIRSLT